MKEPGARVRVPEGDFHLCCCHLQSDYRLNKHGHLLSNVIFGEFPFLWVLTTDVESFRFSEDLTGDPAGSGETDHPGSAPDSIRKLTILEHSVHTPTSNPGN